MDHFFMCTYKGRALTETSNGTFSLDERPTVGKRCFTGAENRETTAEREDVLNVRTDANLHQSEWNIVASLCLGHAGNQFLIHK